MKYIKKAVFITFSTVAMSLSFSAYAQNIAILDSKNAVLNTKVAQEANARVRASIEAQRSKLASIRQQMQSLEQSFYTEKSMSAEKKQALQKQGQQKLLELQKLSVGLQNSIQAEENQLLQKLMPKLETVIKQITQEKSLDIIIEKKEVIFVKPQFDITQEVTKRLDNM